MLASLSTDRTIKLWNITAEVTLIHTLKGHNGTVRSVCFSADGKLLSSASNDKTVGVWETTSGRKLHMLQGHTRSVNDAVISANGTKLASASNDKTVRLWDVDSGRGLFVLKGHADWVMAVAFSQDASLLATAASDKMVCLWDATTGLKMLKFETNQIYMTLSFSEDARYLRVGHKWFDVGTGHESREMVPQTSVVRATIRDDWIVLDGKDVVRLPPAYRATCSAMNGDVLALGLASGRVTILEFNPLDHEA
jgi:WD40 repeat protein